VLLDDVETLSDEGVSTFYGITLAIDTQNILSVVALAGLDLLSPEPCRELQCTSGLAAE
jgi:hypothetical protein